MITGIPPYKMVENRQVNLIDSAGFFSSTTYITGFITGKEAVLAAGFLLR
jgi:hypothetical protein